MSLEVVFRPQKDLYVNNPPEAYDVSYYNSQWVSAHLPIQYKISNTKFPENQEDSLDNICTVTNLNGFAQISLCGTYETYVEQEYVKVSGTNVYDGVYQILSVVNSTTFVINAVYTSSATGTFQRYYNSYHNLVKVYAGIPSYHQYASEKPMELIATIKVVPDSDNLSIVDVAGLVKSKINMDNDLNQISDPNDLNAWAGFYIEYAESYDVSDGIDNTQFISSYTQDKLDDCIETNVIQNGSFTTDLNGWTNGGSGSFWVYNTNKAQVTRGGNDKSTTLYQEVTLLQGVEYIIRVDWTNVEGNNIDIRLHVADNTSLSPQYTIYNESTKATAGSVYYKYTPNKTYYVFGFSVKMYGSSAQVITFDNLSATVSDCKYYGFAFNGVKQFQDYLGGNFGDYVQNYNSNVFENKFLSDFDSPIWFNGKTFDLGAIVPQSTFNNTVDNSLYYQIKEYTEGGGYLATQDERLQSKGDGVYRLPISDLTLNANTDNFTIQLYHLPSNKLQDCAGGTFEYTSNPAGDPPSDWGVTKWDIASFQRSVTYARNGSYSAIMVFNATYLEGTSLLWDTVSSIEVIPNATYVIEGYVLNGGMASAYYGGVLRVIAAGGAGIVSNEEVQYVFSSETGVWNYFKTVVNVGANSSIILRFGVDFDGGVLGGGQLHFDDISIRGPYESLSEVKTINVDNSCTKQDIYLTWMNPLGGWNYYNFKAEKDYSVTIDRPSVITRDILSNWDDAFINSETEDDYISLNAREEVTVRSQFMSLSEIQAVAGIRTSIRVQQIKDNGKKVTVLVDKKSFKIYSDGDKLYSIEFSITYPRKRIQSQ